MNTPSLEVTQAWGPQCVREEEEPVRAGLEEGE